MLWSDSAKGGCIEMFLTTGVGLSIMSKTEWLRVGSVTCWVKPRQLNYKLICSGISSLLKCQSISRLKSPSMTVWFSETQSFPGNQSCIHHFWYMIWVAYIPKQIWVVRNNPSQTLRGIAHPSWSRMKERQQLPGLCLLLCRTRLRLCGPYDQFETPYMGGYQQDQN